MPEQLSPNFWRHEFACHDDCGFDGIDPNLIGKLQILRDEINKPIHINSGCRCVIYNKKIKASSTSSHLLGFAADVYCDNSFDRMKLITSACLIFKRIGVSDEFIHLDIDGSKPQGVFWLYS